MPINQIKTILQRARNDNSFREQLLSNPENALKEYQLSEGEMKKFKSLKSEKLSQYITFLEKRYNKEASTNFTEEDAWWVESVSD